MMAGMQCFFLFNLPVVIVYWRSSMSPFISGRALVCLALRCMLFGASASTLIAGAAGAATDVCGKGASLNPSKIPFSTLRMGDEFHCQNLKVVIGDPAALRVGDDGRGVLEFEWNPFDPDGYENDFFSLDFDFSPSMLSSSSTAGFVYWLEVTDPKYLLETVQLDATINQAPAGRRRQPAFDIPSSVTLIIQSDPSGIAPPGPAVSPQIRLVSDRLSPQPWVDLLLLDQPALRNRIQLSNQWVVGSLSSIDNFKVTFTQVDPPIPTDEVPAPVPVLGAGAAYAFSRRLRRRTLAGLSGPSC